MPWTTTEDLDEYLDIVTPFLWEDPVADTLLVTISDALRTRGIHAFSHYRPVLGWWRDAAGTVGAALIQTPPFPVTLSRCSNAAVQDLLALFGARANRGGQINIAAEHEAAFCEGISILTGAMATAVAVKAEERQRLYRLGRLAPPVPGPAGRARVATKADRGLVVDWFAAFNKETFVRSPPDPGAMVDSRLPWGGIHLWTLDDGTPVSLAARSREAAGMARVAPVYTPPEYRARGYAAVVTASVSQAALDAGVGEVLLFTDLANPISNGVYRRIGYEPVTDRVILAW
jgi:GNAT superfamily N-acetyltransferase